MIDERDNSIADQLIDETLAVSRGPSLEGRRRTRAEQRAETRIAILAATTESLVEDGYAGLTTRRVAERAGVAQSTLMHHFETREALLVEAVTQLALRLAEEGLREIDLAAMRSAQQRELVLDQAWRKFSSPEAVAAAQLWVAAWAEPELAAALRSLEERIGSILTATGNTLFPDHADDPEFLALIDASVSLIRGLVLAIPISGRDALNHRWEAIKPILARTAGQLLDETTP